MYAASYFCVLIGQEFLGGWGVVPMVAGQQPNTRVCSITALARYTLVRESDSLVCWWQVNTDYHKFDFIVKL